MGRKQIIEARMRSLEAELAEVSKYGEDDFPEGTVLRFKYRFNGARRVVRHPALNHGAAVHIDVRLNEGQPTGPWYTYAAIKVKGGWYLTGARQGRLTWDDFVDFLSRGQVKKLRMAASWDGVER